MKSHSRAKQTDFKLIFKFKFEPRAARANFSSNIQLFFKPKYFCFIRETDFIFHVFGNILYGLLVIHSY